MDIKQLRVYQGMLVADLLLGIAFIIVRLLAFFAMLKSTDVNSTLIYAFVVFYFSALKRESLAEQYKKNVEL